MLLIPDRIPMMNFRKAAVALAMLAIPAALPAQESLAGKAREILRDHCGRCHSPEGKIRGGFDYVLRRDLLEARKKIVPGKSAESELFRLVRDGEMPPPGEKVRPTRDEITLLQQWIDSGAADWQPARPTHFVTESDVVTAIRADLAAQPEPQRRFLRYFTIANLANSGAPDDEIETARLALNKLLNSLSWHPRLSPPVGVYLGGNTPGSPLVYRIDLRDYRWNARLWDKLVFEYPYRMVPDSPDAREIAYLTGSDLAWLRADWFVATASRPTLYYDLLQLPSTDRGLERLLGVDVPTGIDELTAARSGFNGSGVSKNNRIIERHDSGFGAYWKTYDFAENIERQNIFDRPLGPPPGRNSFLPAGGEMIFHLPNGLHGYFLAGERGQRIDRAPVQIVSDPNRPDRTVEAGLSCFSCHAAGIIPKADQVRAHVLKNARVFSREDVEMVKALYPEEKALLKLVSLDNRRFQGALTGLGIKLDSPEPVTVVTQRYEAVVDLRSAAADAGLVPEEFSKKLAKSESLSRTLGALQTRGGTVQRDLFVDVFEELVREFRLTDSGSPSVLKVKSSPAPLSLTVTADGKHAASGHDDRTIRLWDVESGKEVRRFEGHRGPVAAVAFSPDGKQIVSAGHDRTVRLWDALTGKELRSFTGHADQVGCATFSADGRFILSGSHDRTLRIWDAATGKEVGTFSGPAGRVSAVAMSADGKLAASAGTDQFVRVWEIESGREIRALHGTTGEVHSVAFSPNGKLVAAGGSDRMVRVWNLETGFEIRRFEGHVNAVVRIAFTADGQRVLSGASQYQQVDAVIRVWNVTTGREERRFGGQARDRIGCVAFSADGRLAVTDGSDAPLRVWRLSD